MGIKKILAVMGLGMGLVASLMIVFAGFFGLDDHSGWGRLRILSLTVSLLTALASALYLLFPVQMDALLGRIGNTTSISGLWKSQVFQKIWEYAFLAPIMGLVFLIYVWLVSSGTWTHWTSPTRYYADLALGFERGKLFMIAKVDPELAELSDPYEPSVRRAADVNILLDASYFDGKYYLYWGPVPALMLTAVQPFYHGKVGDMQLTFLFSYGIFLVLSAFAILIKERFFKDLPAWILGLSILLLGTAGPAAYMLNNYNSAMIYEASITGGQFFMISGMLVASTTFGRSSSYTRLAFCGLLWALATGTRLNLLVPIAAMSFIMFCSWFWMKASTFEKIANTLSLALPLLLMGIGLGWYNWARFGSVTESGLNYQFLKGINLQANQLPLMHPVYILQNLYNNLLHPFAWDPQFPFIRIRVGRMAPLFDFYPLPEIYGAQRMTGLLILVPFVLFAFLLLRRVLPNRRENQGLQGNLYWIVLLAAASFTTSFIFLLFYYFNAMRYLEDFMPSLMILSLIGFWQGYTQSEPGSSWRTRFTALGVSLAGISILVSLLLALSINDARFELARLFVHP